MCVVFGYRYVIWTNSYTTFNENEVNQPKKYVTRQGITITLKLNNVKNLHFPISFEPNADCFNTKPPLPFLSVLTPFLSVHDPREVPERLNQVPQICIAFQTSNTLFQ